LNKFFIENSVKLKIFRKIGARSSYCWKALDEQDFMEIISLFLDLRCGRC
jgi:hypothetical protein